MFVTFVMMASFFMFSKASVQAAEIVIKGNENEDSNFSFVLEEKVVGEPSNGYVIAGVNDACEGVVGCVSVTAIENLVLPDEYNGYPIVAIKDGTSTIEGGYRVYNSPLAKLSAVKIGKITGGQNLSVVGDFAFASLDAAEVYLSSSVTNLGKYIFDGSKVSDLYIGRYVSSSNEPNPLTNAQVETFAWIVGTPKLNRIIFDNSSVRSEYLSANINYNLVEAKLTYEIVYEFYDEGVLRGEITYYADELVQEVVSLGSRVGLEFKGWFYGTTYGGQEFSVGSSYPEGDGNSVNKVYSKWGLEGPTTLEMKTYVGGNLDSDNKVEYTGDDTRIDIVVDQELAVSGYSVTYTWYKKLFSTGRVAKIDGVTGNTFSLYNADESGTYYCEMTFSYGEFVESRTEQIYLDVEIIKRDLKISVKGQEIVYGDYVDPGSVEIVINQSTPLLEGHIIKTISSPGYEHKLSAGVYENVLEAQIVNICKAVLSGLECDENVTKNYLINYNVIVESKGTLEVLKKDVVVGLEIANNRIIYGENEDLTGVKEDTAYGETKVLNLTYARHDSSNKNVGAYSIDGVSVDAANAVNYNVSLDSNDYKFYIDQKAVVVKWYPENPETFGYIYNGESQEIRATYDALGVETPLNLIIRKNNEIVNFVNAGTYVVDVDLDDVSDNYLLSNLTKTIVIDKAQSEFDGRREVVLTYDGQVHNAEVTLNHNEKQLKREFVSVECKNATIGGNPCKVKVSVEESENYKEKMEIFNIYIEKRILRVNPKPLKIEYGTENIASMLKETVASDIPGETVDVNYVLEYVEGGMNVGFYKISEVKVATSPSNYEVVLVDGSGINKVEIVPAPIEVVFFLFSDNLVYNGKVQNVEVRVDGASASAVGLVGSYDDNKQPINAGDYRYSVTVTNKNYYIDGTNSIEFSIAKANYDISGLKLNDKNVKFDFKGHSIELEGELPKGLSYTYEIDGVKGGNGTSLPYSHTVKVYFEGDFENYNVLEPLVATLYVDMSWVWVALVLTVLSLGLIVAGIILLIKFRVLRFTKRVKRRAFARIIRKNRVIDDINVLISSTRKEIEKEEKIEIIEENVKFIKTEPIKVNSEIISMSFVDELFKADKAVKEYYSEIKNELLSYEGVSSKIKRDFETFYLHNLPIARLDIEKGTLYAFYALDPTVYKVEEYKHENVSKKKEFAVVPLKLKVNSLQSLRHAKMFVRIIRKRENIKSVSNFVRMDYARVYSAKESTFKLFKKVFIKRSKKGPKMEEIED